MASVIGSLVLLCFFLLLMRDERKRHKRSVPDESQRVRPITRRVAFKRWLCRSCGSERETPWLHEMSYGEFILRSENGAAFGYLNAIEEPAWAEVDRLFPRGGEPTDDQRLSVETPLLQATVSRLADKIEGMTLRMDDGACPRCGEHQRDHLGDGTPRDIPYVTFRDFLAMSAAERRDAVVHG